MIKKQDFKKKVETYIPPNPLEHFLESLITFPGMSSKILQNLLEHSPDSLIASP